MRTRTHLRKISSWRSSLISNIFLTPWSLYCTSFYIPCWCLVRVTGYFTELSKRSLTLECANTRPPRCTIVTTQRIAVLILTSWILDSQKIVLRGTVTPIARRWQTRERYLCLIIYLSTFLDVVRWNCRLIPYNFDYRYNIYMQLVDSACWPKEELYYTERFWNKRILGRHGEKTFRCVLLLSLILKKYIGGVRL